jgi:aminoglycoside phosphotransferase (APT) family kinase protein
MTDAVVVGIDVARRLVEDVVAPSFPEAGVADLRVVDGGWDNLIVRVGPSLVLRLPVRQEAVPLVVNEARWLAEAAGPMPVPVPVPLLLGEPTSYYPWPWTLTRWIDGEVLDDVPVAERGGAVDGLADALLALHRPAPPDAPQNPFRGVPLAQRAAIVEPRIQERFPSMAAPLLRLWAEALEAPAWPGPSLWLHGDPHPRNLLADRTGLVGIIDFGDITSGDPASDLATAWWCFGSGDRARFRARIDAAGVYDAQVWRRAAGWAVAVASAIPEGTAMTPAAHRTVAHLLGA